MEVNEHESGMFSWADLPTPDALGSTKFYTKLLELDATESPVGEGAVYVMLSKNGKNSCAIYEMNEEMKSHPGAHPAWQCYFTVESADDTAAKVSALGGTVVQEPFDVMEEGRMAVMQDPTGAGFAVWEPQNSIGAQVFGEPGALAWGELYTHDTEAASKFYNGLFGWSVNKRPAADGSDYFEFHIEGRSAVGMMAIRPEWGEMPANWSIYFAVADLDDTIKRAKELGAADVSPPMEVEDVGRFAFLHDPQGAYVSFIQVRRPAA